MRTAIALSLALAAPPLDAQEMTDAEREAFRAEVRAYLLENPEVIMEAVGVRQAHDPHLWTLASRGGQGQTAPRGMGADLRALGVTRKQASMNTCSSRPENLH